MPVQRVLAIALLAFRNQHRTRKCHTESPAERGDDILNGEWYAHATSGVSLAPVSTLSARWFATCHVTRWT
jgi:hypothetical protein